MEEVDMMKKVKCISIRETEPNQIKVGQNYFIDETSKYVESDGDEYATVYEDEAGTKVVANMLTSHFTEV